MDYEKAYKDALERAKEFQKSKDGLCVLTAESIFPELKESEDERIRRNIIAALRGEGYYDCDLTNECIAWLEKQSNKSNIFEWHSVSEEPEENKELFCEWESDDATWHDVAFYDEESHTFRHAKKPINVTKWVYVDELLEKQGEQKSSWCEDDERIVTALMEGFRYHQLFNPRFGEVPNAEIISWIKSLKERLS